MRTNLLSLYTAIVCAFIGVVSNSAANAQTYNVEASKPTFDDLPSPEFGGGKQKAFKPKDWLEIEASIKVQMSPEPPSKTAERVMVKWYVAVEHPDKKGAYLLLKKEITYANVPLNEEIFTSVYLSPSSVKRLTGSDRAGKKNVSLVGYEVLINGEKKAQEASKSTNGKTDWWNVASEKISSSDTVPLLNKNESAFAQMWWDRYAEILVERR
jgi:hypothetical protein